MRKIGLIFMFLFFILFISSAPFSIVSGGSYNLNSDQSQVVTIRYQPTSSGAHTGEVVFTGADNNSHE